MATSGKDEECNYRDYIRRVKLNSQFIVTAHISFSIYTKNFEFQSLLPWITPLAIEGVVQGSAIIFRAAWFS